MGRSPERPMLFVLLGNAVIDDGGPGLVKSGGLAVPRRGARQQDQIQHLLENLRIPPHSSLAPVSCTMRFHLTASALTKAARIRPPS
jgi:hypothetical protein